MLRLEMEWPPACWSEKVTSLLTSSRCVFAKEIRIHYEITGTHTPTAEVWAEDFREVELPYATVVFALQ